MQDSVVIKAPAKLNLFLQILGQKSNGYHTIHTGITFLDLYDEVKVSLSNRNSLLYSGPFKPSSSIFKNDIIYKVLNNISMKKETKIKIKIKKNIPWQAGLGSASTDAAALIKGVQQLALINNMNDKFLTKIGADVPACYYGRNCIATGIGDRINTKIDFPKYYFVLVYPKIQLSTSEMYKKINEYSKLNKDQNKKITHLINFHEDNIGNDFEKIIRNEQNEIFNLLKFLSSLKNCIFSRMSGSGSCCYAVFENKDLARKAFDIILKKFKNYWIYLAENNIIID